MELALILLLLALIVAAIGWVFFSAINKLDRASTRIAPPAPHEAGPRDES